MAEAYTGTGKTHAAAEPRLNAVLRVVNRVLLGVVLLAMAFYLLVYVVYAADLIQFPYDYDQGEGFELNDVILFSQGEWPYANIETYPFYGSIYPPLYHVLLIPFVWVFGPALWYGRLVSFLFTLATAYIIGYAVYRETTRYQVDTAHTQPHAIRFTIGMVAAISGLAFLASPIVYHIGPLFRQHIGMVFYETLAVVLLAHVDSVTNSRRRRWILLIGLGLLIAGGYTKQLAAFTAIAVLAFLFIRNPRRALIWGAGFAVVGGAIFAGLTLATDGHWWTLTVVANVKEFNPAQALGLLKVFLTQHGWLLIPAGLLILYELYFDRISIYSLWLVATLVLNAVGAGTWGAGDSYYATVVAAVTLMSGVFIARTLAGSWRFRNNYLSRAVIFPLKRAARPMTLAALLLLPLLYLGYARNVLHMPTTSPIFGTLAKTFGIEDNTGFDYHDPDGYVTLAYAQIGHLTSEADRRGGDRIVEIINDVPDDVPVLSEDAGFSIAADREVITNPVVLKILSEVGAYEGDALVDMIEAQEFGLIILRARFFPVNVNRAITAHYVERERVTMNGFDYVVMEPR